MLLGFHAGANDVFSKMTFSEKWKFMLEYKLEHWDDIVYKIVELLIDKIEVEEDRREMMKYHLEALEFVREKECSVAEKLVKFSMN